MNGRRSLMALLFLSASFLAVACSSPKAIPDRKDYQTVLTDDPLRVRIRQDMFEQFIWPNDIRCEEDYYYYQFARQPMSSHSHLSVPLVEDDLTNMMFYDELDGACIIGYLFKFNDMPGKTETPYRNHLIRDGYVTSFPMMETYPSVWKDGVFYPTLVQAADKGIIPQSVLSDDYWGTVSRPIEEGDIY